MEFVFQAIVCKCLSTSVFETLDRSPSLFVVCKARIKHGKNNDIAMIYIIIAAEQIKS